MLQQLPETQSLTPRSYAPKANVLDASKFYCLRAVFAASLTPTSRKLQLPSFEDSEGAYLTETRLNPFRCALQVNIMYRIAWADLRRQVQRISPLWVAPLTECRPTDFSSALHVDTLQLLQVGRTRGQRQSITQRAEKKTILNRTRPPAYTAKPPAV